ncbi:MAG: hypothetical protein AB8B53_12290 [Flavobacteriales bacterium]
MKKNLILLLVLLVLSGVAYYLATQDKKSTLAANPMSNFTIDDTSAVTKIFIADKVTGTALLTKDESTGHWMINEKYRAKGHAVDLLLKAFNDITVRGTVPTNMKKTVIANAAGTGKKIEIYTDDPDVPEKIWISAGNTQDHHGDFFILEIPGEGISPDPFIVDMPLFGGYLTARFFTMENDWRYSGVFNYSDLDFKEITVKETSNPDQAFTIKWDGERVTDIFNPITGEKVSKMDTLITQDYLIRYKKIHLETYDTHLEQNQIDSVLQRTPDWNLEVTEPDGTVNAMDLFYLPGNDRYTDFNGNYLPYNQDIMYGTRRNGKLVRCQYEPVFMKLMVGLDYFKLNSFSGGQ